MRKVSVLICELSDDEDEDGDELGTSPIDLHSPWHKDFNGYLNLKDQLGNRTIAEWWGVRTISFLVTCDYQLIMKM